VVVCNCINFTFLEHGEVVTFGDGANGQLGHGNKLLEISEPYVLKWNQPTNIIQVSCGEGHTAFVSGIDHFLLFYTSNIEFCYVIVICCHQVQVKFVIFGSWFAI